MDSVARADACDLQQGELGRSEMTMVDWVCKPCPNCGEAVPVAYLATMSFIELPLQSDLFQPGDIEKVETLINTCAACGFTATTDDFMRGKVELSDTVRQQTNTHWRGRDFSDVRTAEQYGLLAQLQLWEDAPPLEVAESYMKGAWCSAYHRSDDEMVYRLYALEQYKRALEANTVPAERLPEVTYLVGELHRRLGEVDRANVYFERIIEQAKTNSNWAAMGQAARQQRDNPRDVLKEQL
jgi:uncharacterized protein (DUF2225 family)